MISYYCSCTCVSGESSDTARVDCAIAEDESFCRCVVSSNGDQSSVSDDTIIIAQHVQFITIMDSPFNYNN